MKFISPLKSYLFTLVSTIGVGLLFTANAMALPITVTGNSFEGEWLSKGDSLSVQVSRLPEANEGNLHLVVGNTDVTSLVQAGFGGDLNLGSSVVSLPRGTSDVVLYLVTFDGQWHELSRAPLNVRDAAGFESSEFTPRVDVTSKGQLTEDHSDDAGEPQRKTYQDQALQAGFTSRHTRNDIELRSSVNLVGSSVQEEALRFGEKADDAPKIDLSDFLLELDKGRASVALGHINYGNNPLLINGVGNRGLMASYRFGERFDVSLTSMNGTSVVGFTNLLGQETRDHNISAATIGVEFLKSRPGGLRMEVTYLDASIESQFNFDVGEVPDAETNTGVGLRLMGSTSSGRLRGDFSIAQSKYRNPDDAVLAQGDVLTKVEAIKDVARHLELSYDLLQNTQLSDSLFASLSLSFTYDRTDPLYRSVAAYAQADWEANQIAASGQIGQVSVQLQYMEGEDNLDDIATLLKTKTENTSASLSVPLQALIGDPQNPSHWLPNLSYNFNRTHQFAQNKPDTANSGFNGTNHLPDQMNVSHGAGLQWSIDRWSLGYQLSQNMQDNRQTGRKTADFETLTHNVTVGVQVTDDFNFGAGTSLGRNTDQAQDLERETRNWSANADWRISQNLAVNGNYSTTRQDDNQDLSENTGESISAQLSWNFSLPGTGRRLPGQVFVRYAYQDNDTDDRQFGFQSNVSNWAVNSGFSLSLF